MKNSAVQLLFLLALLIPIAYARDFSYTASAAPDSAEIKMNETATFTLTVSHDSASVENFEVYSPDVGWDVHTEPTADRILEVQPGTEKTAAVLVRPLNVNPGSQLVRLFVRPLGTVTPKQVFLLLDISPAQRPRVEYTPSVQVVPRLEKVYDPRKDILLEVDLVNKNKRNLSNVAVKVGSAIINRDYETKLEGLERKTLRFTATLDPLTPPQADTLLVTATALADETGYVFNAKPTPFSIGEYGEIVQKQDEEKAYFKTTVRVSFDNTANVAKMEAFKVKAGWWARMFTSAKPSPKVVKQTDGTYLVWDIALGVGENTTVTIERNYRFPVILLVLAVLGVIAYFVLRSPIVVRKSAIILASQEGGINELKVLLAVRNRTKRNVNDLAVLDKIPRMAEYVKEPELGTLAPSRVLRHDKKGTLVTWSVGTIDAQEERIITYHLRSKLSILGGVRLPVAVARFASQGRMRRTTSNPVDIKGLNP
ncbi:hypothetical protein HY642_04470 [Candidatus Woesearchaeota archaeon]|nr:hypothetical protein [Candidatus Woesearchaeota archaeon]